MYYIHLDDWYCGVFGYYKMQAGRSDLFHYTTSFIQIQIITRLDFIYALYQHLIMYLYYYIW